MEGYEKLRIYQLGLEGVKRTHELTKSIQLKNEYWLKDQIQRAAVSVPINIAEGFGRRTQKDNAQFISIALGSINEVKALLDVIEKIYPVIRVVELKTFYTELGKRTYSFRKSLLLQT